MTELDPRARALLDLARSEDAPPIAAKARVRTAIRGELAAPSVPRLPTGSIKVWLATAAIGGIGVGALIQHHSSAPPELPAIAAPAPSHVEGTPAPVESPRAEAPPAPEAKESRVRPSTKRVALRSSPTQIEPREPEAQALKPPPEPAETPAATETIHVVAPAAPPAAPAKELCSLEAELEVLREVRRNLTEPGQALEQLASFEARCPSGSLGLERRALRAIALCRSGKAEKGRREAARLFEEVPDSPFENSVRAECRTP
jgi:hypothetical protein